MKKSKYLLIALFLMILIPTGLILAQSDATYAGQAVPTPTPFQLPTPLPEINTYDQTAQFSFADLDQETFVMRYPSFRDVYMPLPNEWKLISGDQNTFIELHYDFYESSEENAVVPTPHPLFDLYPYVGRPGIEIYVNNILVSIFVPEFGDNNTIQIPITPAAILPSGDNPFNEYLIRVGFYSDADIYCNYDGVLTIYGDSFVKTTFVNQPPFRTLINLPRPLVADSFIPEEIKLIIPDNPQPADLEAVAILTSSIAQNAFSTVTYDVIRASDVVQTDIEKSNTIIIGTPTDNKFLAELYRKQVLPTLLSTNGKDILRSGSDTIADTDGVLQIIPSDVNQYYSFVTVTGESGEGVLRAARAFKQLPVGTPPTLLIITDDMIPAVTTEPETEILQTKFNYVDLGYVDRTRFGLGLQRFFLTFYVPRDWVLEDDVELTINYAYSDAIEARSSNAVVLLNGNPVGNLILQENPAGEQTVVVPLRQENILKGMVNVVEFQVNLTATLICDDYNPDVYWFKVAEDSTLDIPHHLATSPVEMSPVINPTIPFAFETKHLVVLGSNPGKDALNTFANLYSQYGNLNGTAEYDLVVSLDDTVNPDDYPDRNIMMIGLPTSTNLIDQINKDLPQPFTAGTNNLQQNIANAAYQLVPGISIGVIEAIPTSWDYARMITVISGTSAEGLQWSSTQLLLDPARFIGDLFFIQNDTLTSFVSTLFSQPILDALVSEALEEEQLIPVEEPGTQEEVDNIGTTGEFIRDENVNTTTTPMFLMGVIGIVGLIFIIYLASRIASGGRNRKA